MPFEVEKDDEDNNHFYVDGREIKVTNVTVSFGGESYHLDEVSGDTEGDTLNFNIINDWMKKKDKTALIEAGKLIDTANFAIPGANDTITIEFTISGLSEGGSEGGDPASSAPSGDSSTKPGDSSTKSADSSKAGSTSTTSKAAGTANATGTAAGGGSDATDSTAATGATAGLVFAGIALAGAALVVTKRK